MGAELNRGRAAFALMALGVSACNTTPTIGRAGCLGAGCAVVVTSQFAADFTGHGSLSTVTSADPPLITPHLDDTLDADVVLESWNGELLALDEDGGDVRRYDPFDMRVTAQYATGDSTAPAASSLPYAMLVAPGTSKLFITLGANPAANAIGVLDLVAPSPGALRYLALATVAGDDDGAPNAADLYACDGLLYATQQNYTIDSSGAVTYQPGSIAVIDPVAERALGTILLQGRNPNGIAALDPEECGTALVAQGSTLTTVPDGTAGFEKVDLRAGVSSGWLLTDRQLGGRPGSIVIASSTLAFALLYVGSQVNVISFDPQSGMQTNVMSGAGQIDFTARAPAGSLWVGAGSAVNGQLPAGLYRGPGDGSTLPTVPLRGRGGVILDGAPSAIAFE